MPCANASRRRSCVYDMSFIRCRISLSISSRLGVLLSFSSIAIAPFYFLYARYVILCSFSFVFVYFVYSISDSLCYNKCILSINHI
nr:MAG TPA: hypothetical protein [Caudoviricetes sp.]